MFVLRCLPIINTRIKQYRIRKNPTLTRGLQMKTLTEREAIQLALAYAAFTNVRVADLDTRVDYMLAATAAKTLFNVQDETGVVITDPEKLIRLATKLNGIAASFIKGV